MKSETLKYNHLTSNITPRSTKIMWCKQMLETANTKWALMPTLPTLPLVPTSPLEPYHLILPRPSTPHSWHPLGSMAEVLFIVDVHYIPCPQHNDWTDSNESAKNNKAHYLKKQWTKGPTIKRNVWLYISIIVFGIHQIVTATVVFLTELLIKT